MTVADRVRGHLWSAPTRTPEEEEAALGRAHLRGITVVRLFYVVGLYFAARSISSWAQLRDTEVISPQWPAGWLDQVSIRNGVTVLIIAYTLASVAAVTMPRWRLVRTAYAVTFLMHAALVNGFGKIGHGMHGWFWISAVLILLPSDRPAWKAGAASAERRSFLDVVRLAQAVLLFFYTLTGLWKLAYASRDLFGPRVSVFAPEGFSYIVAKSLLRTGRETLLGDLLVRNHLLGWALILGTIYLESASLLIVFRPRLHRAWAVGLILFHVGTQAAMGVYFPQNLVLLGLLLLCSPFAPDEVDLRRTLLDLPGVHLVWRWRRRLLRRRGRAPSTAVGPPVATS